MALDPNVIADIYGEQQPVLGNPFLKEINPTPEQAAQGVKLGRTKGIDGLLAAQHLPQLTKEVEAEQWDDIVKNAPGLAKKMQDPAFTAIAKDDVESLGAIDSLLKFAGDAGESVTRGGAHMAGEGVAGEMQALAETGAAILEPLVGTILPENPLRRAAEAAKQNRLAHKQYLEAIQKARGDESESMSAVHSGLQSAGSTLLKLPLALMSGNPAQLTALQAGEVGGMEFGKARDEGLNVGESLQFAASQGVVEYATEKLPAAAFLKDFAAGKPAREMLVNLLAKEIPGEQVATVLQDLNEWAVINPEKSFSEYLAERPGAAAQTLIATITGATTQTAAVKGLEKVAKKFAGENTKAQQAEQHRNTLETLNEVVEQSKTKARDVETFKQYVAEVADLGPVQDVYVEAEALNQNGFEEAISLMPEEVQTHYMEALQTGGSVQIPLDEFMTHVMGQEQAATILDDVRIDPEGMTFKESQAFQESYQENFKSEVDKVLKTDQAEADIAASVAEVKSTIQEQLNTVGQTSRSVNDAYATMASSYYAIRAAQMGMSPKELFDKMPLQVESGEVSNPQTELEAQEAKPITRTEIDQVLEQALQNELIPQEALNAIGDIETEGLDIVVNGLLDQVVNAGGLEQQLEVLSQVGITPEMVQGARSGFEQKTPLEDYVKSQLPSKKVKRMSDKIKNLRAEIREKRDARFRSKGGDSLARLGIDLRLDRYKDKKRVERRIKHTLKSPNIDLWSKTEINKVVGAVKAFSNANSEITQANLKAAARQFKKLGFNITHTSKHEGVVSSYYLSKTENGGDFKVRLSNHELPMTAHREHNRSIGLTGTWDTEIVVDSGTDINELLGEVQNDLDLAISITASENTSSKVPSDLENNTVFSSSDKGSSNPSGQGTPVDTTYGARGEGSLANNNVPSSSSQNKPIKNLDQDESDTLNQNGLADNLPETITVEGQERPTSNSNGEFSANDNNILKQRTRGAYTPTANTIKLLRNADLSTFLHEMGHAFLNMDTLFAADIMALPEDQRPANADQILNDVKVLFDWFGMEGELSQQINDWHSMTVNQQRDHHEKFAEGFEAYLFKGQAPSQTLQPLFQRFRAWMVSVYRNMQDYLVKANSSLTPEVTAVMDRMLATEDKIKEAQQARGMTNLFAKLTEDEITPEDFEAYAKNADEATREAIETLERRSMRDMTWTSNLKAKTIKRLNKEAEALRREVRIDARREVMSQPLYRAYQFLTRKMGDQDKVKASKSNKNQPLNPSHDSMLEAIAKLGGLNKKQLVSEWGFDPNDKLDAGIFGKPVLRAGDQGVLLDSMAELLAEQGYLTLDENGKYDLREFEEKFGNEASGNPEYSVAKIYDDGLNVDLSIVEAGRLERSEVESMGEEILATLEKRKMLRKVGLPADTVAEMFGYESGQELATALAEANPPRDEIEALTDRYMLERHGDLSTPEAIASAADQAIHNDVRTRMIATELAGLQKATGSVRELSRMAKQYAESAIGNATATKINPNKYARDASKGGREAEKAMKKGDRESAIAHKRGQLVNHALTKAAYEAKSETANIVRRLRKIATTKEDNLKATRNMDLANLAKAVLDIYGFNTGSKSPLEYLELIKAYDPELFAAFQPEIATAMADTKPFTDLTVDQLRGLRDQVESLWFLARRAKQVEIDGKMMDREQVTNELNSRIEELGIPDDQPGVTQAPNKKDRARRVIQGFRAAVRRVEAWVDRMDSGKIKGSFRRYVFTPISEAADDYRIASAEYYQRYKDLLDTIAPSLKQGRIAAPELNYTFGHDNGDSGMAELLHAILHTGNASNKRKLILGRAWGTEVEGELDTTQWDSFIDRMISEGKLTKAHFDFVQSVWDMLEDTKPLAQKTHREVFGRYFDEVTADSFTNQFGTYQGGYVPALVDPFIVQDAEINQGMDAVNESNVYMFPSTSRGFTKSRVEYNRPLALDLRLIPQHVDKVLMFAYLERPVRDVQRTLKSVQGTLSAYDPVAYTDMLLPWLNRASKQLVQQRSSGAAGRAADRFFSTIRSRAGMGIMFGNVTNALQQITGFSITLLKVKPSYLANGLVRYLKNPTQTAESIAEISPFMKTRLEQQSFHLRGEIEDILLNPSKFDQVKNWTSKHAYFLQAAFQNVVDTISWQAAYNQNLAEGQTESDAIRAANSAVRETQGSLNPEDISRFETGSPFARLFTQFASYFNMQANVMGTEFGTLAQELGVKKGMGRAFYVTVMGLLIPAWVAEAIVIGMRGGTGDGDDEYLDEWMGWFFGAPVRNVTAMLPGVGQTINLVAGGFTDSRYDDRMSLSPAISVIEAAAKTPAAVYDLAVNDGRAKPAIKDTLTLINLYTGVPVMLVGRPLGYAADVAEGSVTPANDADFIRGLIAGSSSPASRN